MTPRTILAVGGHIGDMDLAVGPLLTQNVLDGGRSILIALTPGERGHPSMPIEKYKAQKIAEAHEFATAIGGEALVYEDLSDGFLTCDDTIAARLAKDIRRIRPHMLLAHWPHSIHTDHEQASLVAQRARFLAGLPGWEEHGGEPEGRRHGIEQFFYAENWEDADQFHPDSFAQISDQARQQWHTAINGQAFARGETYGFRYIDFYEAQLTTRGCLAGVPNAVALCEAEPELKQV